MPAWRACFALRSPRPAPLAAHAQQAHVCAHPPEPRVGAGLQPAGGAHRRRRALPAAALAGGVLTLGCGCARGGEVVLCGTCMRRMGPPCARPTRPTLAPPRPTPPAAAALGGGRRHGGQLRDGRLLLAAAAPLPPPGARAAGAGGRVVGAAVTAHRRWQGMWPLPRCRPSQAPACCPLMYRADLSQPCPATQLSSSGSSCSNHQGCWARVPAACAPPSPQPRVDPMRRQLETPVSKALRPLPPATRSHCFLQRPLTLPALLFSRPQPGSHFPTPPNPARPRP